MPVYCRISQDRNGDGLGVERQETLCRDLAQRKGWTVAEVYTDNDRSAYSGKPRPEYERMLADIAAGRRDAVLVVDTDRLTRQPRELEDFITLADRHGIALANGDMDLSSSDGRFRARILGAVARQESEKKSERIRRQREQAALAGHPHPGPRAFGFEDDNVTLRESEARLIRTAAAAVLAGRSIRSIADEWNGWGSPPHAATDGPSTLSATCWSAPATSAGGVIRALSSALATGPPSWMRRPMSGRVPS